jgi:hypothetical protein
LPAGALLAGLAAAGARLFGLTVGLLVVAFGVVAFVGVVVLLPLLPLVALGVAIWLVVRLLRARPNVART